MDHETKAATIRLSAVWLVGWFSNITLSQVGLTTTIIYTLLQCFFLLRDKWWRQRNKKPKTRRT